MPFKYGPAIGSGAVVLLATLGMGTSACAQQDDTKVAETKKPDSGKFAMTIMGIKAGACAFKFDADGGSVADVDLSIGGQEQKFKVTDKAKDGKMTGFASSAGPSNHFTVDIDGDKAKVSVNGGATKTQSIPKGSLPFGNFSPHLANYALAAYDPKKTASEKPGGKPTPQTVSLVLIEGLPDGDPIAFKAKLLFVRTKDVTIGGKPIAVSTYDLTIEAGGQEIDMKLYANAEKRLLAWDVLSQNYMAVREGYEEVLKSGGK